MDDKTADRGRGKMCKQRRGGERGLGRDAQGPAARHRRRRKSSSITLTVTFASGFRSKNVQHPTTATNAELSTPALRTRDGLPAAMHFTEHPRSTYCTHCLGERPPSTLRGPRLMSSSRFFVCQHSFLLTSPSLPYRFSL